MASAPQKRRIMKEFELDEISAVDRPAQTPARVTIMKRAVEPSMDDEDDEEDAVEAGKGCDGESGRKPMAKTNPNHEDAAESGDRDMTDKTVEKSAELKAAEAKAEELQKSLDQANLMASLSDVEKAHLATLEGEAKGEFLCKGADERAKVLAEIAKAAADADPVVYKAADGSEFRKSDDARLVEMAKRNDKLAADLEKREQLAKRADLEKRATVLKNLPGDLDVHCALLAAVDGIADESLRKGAMAALSANDAGVAKASEEVGVGGHDSAADGSAQEQLDSLAKAYASEHKMTFEKAFVEVTKTEAGRKLVFEMRGQQDKQAS